MKRERWHDELIKSLRLRANMPEMYIDYLEDEFTTRGLSGDLWDFYQESDCAYEDRSKWTASHAARMQEDYWDACKDSEMETLPFWWLDKQPGVLHYDWEDDVFQIVAKNQESVEELTELFGIELFDKGSFGGVRLFTARRTD